MEPMFYPEAREMMPKSVAGETLLVIGAGFFSDRVGESRWTMDALRERLRGFPASAVGQQWKSTLLGIPVLVASSAGHA
jgi:hypothetical protein